MYDVTVIVPNYNHQLYLKKRIDSVLSQDYRNYEMIILDDKSTDNSREIIESYRDLENVRILYNEENSGSPFIQWNKGVKLATGKYIWLAESDDYNEPGFLSKMIERLDSDESISLAFCKSFKVDENDRIVSKWEDWVNEEGSEKWTEDFIHKGDDEVLRHLKYGLTIPNASSILFRRDVYLSIGLAPENMRVAGDWMTWTKMLKNNKVAFVSKELNYFRNHSNNARTKTQRNGIRLKEDIEVKLYIIKNFRIKMMQRLAANVNISVLYIDEVLSKETKIPIKRVVEIFINIIRYNPLLILILIFYSFVKPIKAIAKRCMHKAIKEPLNNLKDSRKC